MKTCYFDSGLGEMVCDEPAVSIETVQTIETLFLWVIVFLIALTLIVFVARYSYGVATRTGRSRIGFVWLSLLFPLAALGICLVLDQDDERYTEEERNKYRLRK
jgi:hypothetical protein